MDVARARGFNKTVNSNIARRLVTWARCVAQKPTADLGDHRKEGLEKRVSGLGATRVGREPLVKRVAHGKAVSTDRLASASA